MATSLKTTTTVTPFLGSATAPVSKELCPTSKYREKHPVSLKGGRKAPSKISFENMALITLDAIGDAVVVIDPKGYIIYLNRVAEKLTGWPSEEAVGLPVGQVFVIVDGVTRQRAVNPAHKATRERCIVELALGSVLIRRDGTELAIEDSAAPILNHKGTLEGAVIVFHDARQSGTEIQKMNHLALHDSLTGLPNRALLMERLSHAIAMADRHNQKIALLFVDLDHFKDINDSFGHTVGDHLLQKVAQTIQSCIRLTDTVCRHGGDEFVILLNEIEHREDAALIAEKLLSKAAVPHRIDGHDFIVTLSIGISLYPESGTDAEALMRNSDKAMYITKESGRNSYQFFHSC